MNWVTSGSYEGHVKNSGLAQRWRCHHKLFWPVTLEQRWPWSDQSFQRLFEVNVLYEFHWNRTVRISFIIIFFISDNLSPIKFHSKVITVYQESITLLAMVKNLAADFKRFLTSVEYDPPEEWSQTTKAATDENIEKVNNMSLNGRYLKVYESQGFLQAVCRICEMLSQNKRENESFSYVWTVIKIDQLLINPSNCNIRSEVNCFCLLVSIFWDSNRISLSDFLKNGTIMTEPFFWLARWK